MFLYEKILRNHPSVNPLPTSKGFVVYEVVEKNISTVEAIAFFWEVSRGRPNYYSFRFSKLIKNNRGEFILDHNSQSVAWDHFFDYWNTIKIRLKQRNAIKSIATDAVEAKWLLWKSFVATQDYVLSQYMHNFPISFYNSLDENIPILERTRHMHTFLYYLREVLPFIFDNWNTYYESNLDYHFCYWFKDYFMQNDE